MSRSSDGREENETAGICTCKHQPSTESDHEEASQWYRCGYRTPAQDIHTTKEPDQRKNKTKQQKRDNILVRLIQAVIVFIAPETIVGAL